MRMRFMHITAHAQVTLALLGAIAQQVATVGLLHFELPGRGALKAFFGSGMAFHLGHTVLSV